MDLNNMVNLEDYSSRKKLESEDDKNNEAIEQVVSSIHEYVEDLEDLGIEDFLVMILSMPDEVLDSLAPILLNEFKKDFNEPQQKLMIAQMLNISGTSSDEVLEGSKIICQAIDDLDEEVASPLKKDILKQIIAMTYNAAVEAVGTQNRIVNVPIELVSENAIIPTYAHPGDGAVDLYAPDDYVIGPGERIIIPIDIKVALPYGYAFLIHPRSGLSSKTGLRVANSIGLVDSQYKGNIGVIIENIEPKIKDITYDFDPVTHKPIIGSILHGASYTISKGDRFAQMRLVEVPTANFIKVKSVEGIGDDRGGGFGSSGVK